MFSSFDPAICKIIRNSFLNIYVFYSCNGPFATFAFSYFATKNDICRRYNFLSSLPFLVFYMYKYYDCIQAQMKSLYVKIAFLRGGTDRSSSSVSYKYFRFIMVIYDRLIIKRLIIDLSKVIYTLRI